MKFTNTEQIREKFIKDGWSKDTTFEEVSLEEAEKKGYLFAINGIVRGEKYFKMNVSGNVFNDKGEILLYNI